MARFPKEFAVMFPGALPYSDIKMQRPGISTDLNKEIDLLIDKLNARIDDSPRLWFGVRNFLKSLSSQSGLMERVLLTKAKADDDSLLLQIVKVGSVAKVQELFQKFLPGFFAVCTDDMFCDLLQSAVRKKFYGIRQEHSQKKMFYLLQQFLAARGGGELAALQAAQVISHLNYEECQKKNFFCFERSGSYFFASHALLDLAKQFENIPVIKRALEEVAQTFKSTSASQSLHLLDEKTVGGGSYEKISRARKRFYQSPYASSSSSLPVNYTSFSPSSSPSCPSYSAYYSFSPPMLSSGPYISIQSPMAPVALLPMLPSYYPSFSPPMFSSGSYASIQSPMTPVTLLSIPEYVATPFTPSYIYEPPAYVITPPPFAQIPTSIPAVLLRSQPQPSPPQPTNGVYIPQAMRVQPGTGLHGFFHRPGQTQVPVSRDLLQSSSSPSPSQEPS